MVKESMQRIGFLIRAFTQRRLDGLDILEMDHMRVELLFLRWRFTTRLSAREELFSMIKKELLNHAQLEETVFYPACEKILELKRLVADSQEEHKIIKALLREISELPQNHERTITKMRVLMEEVEHHVWEEENMIFPRIRFFMKKNQLDKLSRDLRLAKRERPARVQKVAA